MQEHVDAAEAIMETAEKEDRDRTEKENEEIAEHQKALKTLRENKREWEEHIATEEDVAKAAGKATAPRRPTSAHRASR